MARQVKLDFRGAPPVSGGMRDHIPPGTYRLMVAKMEDTTSKTGKRMMTASYKVSLGEHAGANLGDNFVLVDNEGKPSKMGLGRLHHFLLCLRLGVKEAVVNLDLDQLSGKEFEADVADEHFTDNSGNDRVSSAIRAVRPLPSSNGVSATPQAPVATSEPTTEQVSEEAPFEVDSSAPEAEVTSEQAEEVAEEIDDLFT